MDLRVRPRRPEDLPALGEILRRDHPRSRYPYVLPDDPAAWVAETGDLAAFVATDAAGDVVGHVAVEAAPRVDHGTGPALQEAWSRAAGRPPQECAVVSRLFVSADHRRAGVGARRRAARALAPRGLAAARRAGPARRRSLSAARDPSRTTGRLGSGAPQ